MIFQFFTRKLRIFTKIFSQFLATSLFIAYFGSHLNIQRFRYDRNCVDISSRENSSRHATVTNITLYTHTYYSFHSNKSPKPIVCHCSVLLRYITADTMHTFTTPNLTQTHGSCDHFGWSNPHAYIDKRLCFLSVRVIRNLLDTHTTLPLICDRTVRGDMLFDFYH